MSQPWHVVTEEGYVHSEHATEQEATQECDRASADPKAQVVYRVVSAKLGA